MAIKKKFTQGIHKIPSGLCFKNRSFRCEEGKLKGLTTGHLKNKYYKDFDLKNAVYEDTISPHCSYENDNVKATKNTCYSTKARMARGRKVDSMIGQAIEWMLMYNLHQNTFCKAHSVPKELDKKYKTWMKNDPARLVFCLLSKMSLKPVATQVIVADKANKLSTAVDLVCKDKSNKYMLIEIKAINVLTMLKYSKQMKDLPLTNCYLNQSFLQLASTRQMYIKTFPSNELSESAYTFVVNNKSCTAYKLPALLKTKRIY